MDTPDFPHGPLHGVRVIELGQLLAGPFCGQLLADFGAEVIKVEPPGVGDPMREWGREKAHGKTLWWPLIARNKKSITCDLRTEQGQEIIKSLAADADVLLENFRPGTLEKWNLGPDVLKAINPRLVLVRVSGYGQTGPYASRAGFGSIGEAMGGLRYVCGDPSTAPSRVGIAIGDTLAAMHAALGTVMALFARERIGRGQIVDSAIYEAVLNFMESIVIEYDQAGYIRERSGPILPNIAPSNVYPTADGLDILIGANQDSVFRRLCQAMQRPELADDERYATHWARGSHQKQLDDLIADWTRTLKAADLLALMEEHGVPAGGIYRAPEMMADPHFQARQAIVRVAHPDLGQVAMQNVAPRLSETPGSVRHCGPALGEHTEEVLTTLLSMPPERVAQLKTAGVI
ncbi:CaiB/BaiF CoA transferase family protein [Bordetella petrii]|uniref:Probable acyl-CoA transferase/carnitine dehydrastase n=1 Tax=Bordetella petrii (strain ATCC BAA-461 / DSM 12804 / CCUG 43448 / CIP 107267 / Se-1111R) TaxID=340100 RepID=A9IR35_BORPD|nr:CaiB/BaiF CoA-transferase family protein [Bordetella petrii]CAP43127.1 Probable acyl-CoA transferase/carnitine dehydrastase [Bordetella petrii]